MFKLVFGAFTMSALAIQIEAQPATAKKIEEARSDTLGCYSFNGPVEKGKTLYFKARIETEPSKIEKKFVGSGTYNKENITIEKG